MTSWMDSDPCATRGSLDLVKSLNVGWALHLFITDVAMASQYVLEE